jgi:formylglycine-generating enzyme required for sulfatase activity
MKPLLVILGLAVAATASPQDRDLQLAPSAPRRLALVIGNDTYVRSPLGNARNDARSMAQALRRLSFDVTVVEDGTRLSIGSAMLAFSRRLTDSDLALVFFAGHGVQVEGVNYLIPVDFDGRSEDEVRLNAISSDELTRALRRSRVGVLVLDACRDNPYSDQRSSSRGLAQLEAQGLLVAFATGAGQTAGDDAPGVSNSVFTSELVQVLGAPGRGLRETFFEVQRRVQARTDGRQFPAVYSQLVSDVVLTPGTSAAPVADFGSAPVPAPPSTAPSSGLVLQAELALWDAIKDSRSVAAFEDYLKRYPMGLFRVPAEERLRAIRPATLPAASPAAPATPSSSPALSANLVARGAVETRSDPRVPGVQWATIPAGTFNMGCLSGDGECVSSVSPRHSVRISKPFELMTTEVTVETTKAVGHSVQDQPTWSRDDHPVVNINWNDATALCAAIGGRLPTEAEWEYAARGGAGDVKYPWGNELPVATPTVRNGARFNPSGSTIAVASFAPNENRLYDMGGNVWEWVADWYGPYTSAAQSDPRGPRSGASRGMRGGSWDNDSRLLHVWSRGNSTPALRSSLVGVRCARDVSQ